MYRVGKRIKDLGGFDTFSDTGTQRRNLSVKTVHTTLRFQNPAAIKKNS